MRTCYLQTIYEDNCYLSTRTRVCSSQVFAHLCCLLSSHHTVHHSIIMICNIVIFGTRSSKSANSKYRNGVDPWSSLIYSHHLYLISAFETALDLPQTSCSCCTISPLYCCTFSFVRCTFSLDSYCTFAPVFLLHISISRSLIYCWIFALIYRIIGLFILLCQSSKSDFSR